MTNNLIAYYALDNDYPTEIAEVEVCHNCELAEAEGKIADYIEETFEKPVGYHYVTEGDGVSYDYRGQACRENLEKGDMVLVLEDDTMHRAVVMGENPAKGTYRVIDEYGGVHYPRTTAIFAPDSEFPGETKNRLVWLSSHDRLPTTIYKVLIINCINDMLSVQDYMSFTQEYAARAMVERLDDFDLEGAIAIVIKSQPINDITGPNHERIEAFYNFNKEHATIREIYKYADCIGFREVLDELGLDTTYIYD